MALSATGGHRQTPTSVYGIRPSSLEEGYWKARPGVWVVFSERQTGKGCV